MLPVREHLSVRLQWTARRPWIGSNWFSSRLLNLEMLGVNANKVNPCAQIGHAPVGWLQLARELIGRLLGPRAATLCWRGRASSARRRVRKPTNAQGESRLIARTILTAPQAVELPYIAACEGMSTSGLRNDSAKRTRLVRKCSTLRLNGNSPLALHFL